MGAPLDIAVTYRSEKGAPLTADEVDANTRALVAAIQKLATTGPGTGLDAAEYDPNTGVVTLVDSANNVLGAFPLPPRPVNPKGTWQAATAYAQGDLVRVDASATVPLGLVALATTAFTSDASDPAVDIASKALFVLVYDGRPAQTYKGVFAADATYAVGDTVSYTPTGTIYQLISDAPAGTLPTAYLQAADGTVTFPWAPVSLPGYRAIRIRLDGKPSASAVLVRELADRVGTFGTNLTNVAYDTRGPNSVVKSKIGATAQAQFALKVNGNVVGYITFAPAAAGSPGVAGLSTTNAAPVNVAAGDLIEVIGPATQDATLSDLYGFLSLVQY